MLDRLRRWTNDMTVLELVVVLLLAFVVGLLLHLVSVHVSITVS